MNTEVRELTADEIDLVTGGTCASTEIVITGAWGKFSITFAECGPGTAVVPTATFDSRPYGQGQQGGKGGSPK